MNNYKPLFNKVDVWEEPITCAYIDSYRKETETKLSNKQKVKIIKSTMEDFEITDEDLKIFNKILGDHQILDKIIFVTDNSYRRNSITFDVFSPPQRSGQRYGHFIFTSYDLYDKNKYGNYKMPSKKIINYIKNNYESIFLMLPANRKRTIKPVIDNTYDEIKKSMRFWR